jgi:hypothetical protein
VSKRKSNNINDEKRHTVHLQSQLTIKGPGGEALMNVGGFEVVILLLDSMLQGVV